MNDYHIPFTIDIPGGTPIPTYLDIEPALKKWKPNQPLGIAAGYGEFGAARIPSLETPERQLKKRWHKPIREQIIETATDVLSIPSEIVSKTAQRTVSAGGAVVSKGITEGLKANWMLIAVGVGALLLLKGKR